MENSFVSADDIHAFWFGAPPANFDDLMALLRRHNPSLDDAVRGRFSDTIGAARRGEFDDWGDDPRGLLALVLVLDQFPRHAFRGHRDQYLSDEKALALALEAMDAGWDREMSFLEAMFLGMPLAHSEDVNIQRRSVAHSDRISADAPPWIGFFAEIPPAQSRKYLGVIERFGRFPHRNEMLGRTSTPDELEFLKTWASIQAPDALRERGLIQG